MHGACLFILVAVSCLAGSRTSSFESKEFEKSYEKSQELLKAQARMEVEKSHGGLFDGRKADSSYKFLKEQGSPSFKFQELLKAQAYSDSETHGALYKMESIEIITEQQTAETSMSNNATEVKKFNVTIKYLSTLLPLQMEENEVTLKGGLKVIWYNENGTKVVADDDDTDNCRFYQGRLIDNQMSSAAISICNNQLEGAILANDQQYIIKPTNESVGQTRGRNGIVFGAHWITIAIATKNKDNRYG